MYNLILFRSYSSFSLLQVVARMKAAEAAIQRMSGLITHLAGASDLADVGDVSDVTDEREEKLPEEVSIHTYNTK